MSTNALIVGAGEGISAAFARALAKDGARIALAARDTAKLAPLANGLRAIPIACDVTKRVDVAALFSRVDAELGPLDVVLFNASGRARGPLVDLNPDDVANTLAVGAMGGFLVAQEAARRMVPRGSGAIFFTGASASVKGYAQSAPFAMAKFALRGLAQSMARELQPKGIHVAHFVIDGGVRNPARGAADVPGGPADAYLDPDAIAQSYLSVLKQPRSAWTWEMELRPWVEKF
jgi:NAD(P)-dependent dehydrogenase (short-subunit alcohol dehydrogenase family)